jgi:hypothetical protein
MNAAERIADHRWWHTIEVAPGIVTDVPARRTAQGPAEPRAEPCFALAAELVGSNAEYRERNV